MTWGTRRFDRLIVCIYERSVYTRLNLGNTLFLSPNIRLRRASLGALCCAIVLSLFLAVASVTSHITGRITTQEQRSLEVRLGPFQLKLNSSSRQYRHLQISQPNRVRNQRTKSQD